MKHKGHISKDYQSKTARAGFDVVGVYVTIRQWIYTYMGNPKENKVQGSCSSPRPKFQSNLFGFLSNPKTIFLKSPKALLFGFPIHTVTLIIIVSNIQDEN